MIESFWNNLSADTQATLLEIGALQVFTPGQLIQREGEASSGLKIVLEGLLQFSSTHISGHGIHFANIPAGDVFGQATVFLDEPRGFTVTAIQNSKVLQLTKQQSQLIFRTNAEVAESIARSLSVALSDQVRRLQNFRVLSPMGRTAAALRTLQKDGESKLNITQSHVSVVAGISRLQAHRALTIFKTLGIVSMSYGCIEIKDVRRLKDLETRM
jgi:CRP/FNR family cyclic AMP-dependent transcriptional regulator